MVTIFIFDANHQFFDLLNDERETKVEQFLNIPSLSPQPQQQQN